ncbi:MAG: hypothetical protein A4E37_00358 [Methanoregulaceae archaeon PtaB.Bin056]|nr:MAG: hypothetical protein A4E37_00358 [Methanoregulaceae archaeon PtaB.Bin056]
MIIAEISIVPVGTGTPGVSAFVKAALEELKKQERVRVEPGAMGTVIEASNLRDLFDAVERAHNSVLAMGAKRVVTEVKIDERRDKEATIESKIRTLQ